MSDVRSVPVREHDFSGIPVFENLELPLYAAVTGDPEQQWDYFYAELYRDGTLRLRTNIHTLDEPVGTILQYNPWTDRGFWSDTFAGDRPGWTVDRARSLLEASGVPPSILTEQPAPTTELGELDPYAGTARGSAQRLTDQALSALQFSRWANYDHGTMYFDDMDRRRYAAALGVLSARFGDTVLADSANHTTAQHLKTLHTDMHTPGLRHKPHSDGPPRNGKYMDVATQVIRDEHPILQNMRYFGRWVNFLSLYGDVDFWSVTREQHPDVFHDAVDHLKALGPEFVQEDGMYVRRGVINPTRLVAEYFPAAYAEIVSVRPDFTPEPNDPPALTVERR